MTSKDFTVTITVAGSTQDVFKQIGEVSSWWTTDFEGSSVNLNDEFVISHGDPHYSKHKLVEIIPDKRMVWLITDSRLSWLERNKHEWTGTKMIFELTPDGDKTVVRYTHEGLVPGMECYERCSQGWEMVIKERLFKFLSEGKTII